MILDGGVETEVQRLSGRNPNQEMWGAGALSGARDRARRASRPPRGGLQRPLHRHLVDSLGARGRRGALGSPTASRATGSTSRASASSSRARPRRRPGANRTAPSPSRSPRKSTRRAVARRSSCWRACSRTARRHAAAGDPHADPRPGHVDGGAVRDRAAGVALLPALPPRRVRRLRAALGPAGGRPLRPRGQALRADRHRCPADQLPAVDHVPGIVSWLRDFTELPLASTRTSAI